MIRATVTFYADGAPGPGEGWMVDFDAGNLPRVGEEFKLIDRAGETLHDGIVRVVRRIAVGSLSSSEGRSEFLEIEVEI